MDILKKNKLTLCYYHGLLCCYGDSYTTVFTFIDDISLFCFIMNVLTSYILFWNQKCLPQLGAVTSVLV